MREEFETYLTTFTERLTLNSDTKVSWSAISNQAATAMAVLDVKLVQLGVRSEMRSYSQFCAEYDRIMKGL